MKRKLAVLFVAMAAFGSVGAGMSAAADQIRAHDGTGAGQIQDRLQDGSCKLVAE